MGSSTGTCTCREIEWNSTYLYRLSIAENKSTVCERLIVSTVDENTAILNEFILFSVLDAESGFHWLPLFPESHGPF